ncbi:MAG TPA: gluconolactonase, partial [Pseudomonas sp.]|nr:gluconolactonase [Pseudomonas sp.]
PNKQLLRWNASDASVTRWTGDQMIACIARREGDANRWVAGMEDGIFDVVPQNDGTL